MDTTRPFILSSSIKGRRREMLLAPSIIRTTRWPSEHAIQNISKSAYNALEKALRRAMKNQADALWEPLFRMLDAYLLVTDQRITFANDRFNSIELLIGFCGALYSPKFLHASLEIRHKWLSAWRATLAIASPSAFERIPRPSTVRVEPWFADTKKQFEQTPLNGAQVDLWRGWPIPKSNGLVAWPDLREIYLRYNKSFAEAIAVALAAFTSGRKLNGISVEVLFCNFLGTLPAEWKAADFLIFEKTSQLFVRFLLFLTDTYGKAGNQYSTLASDWNRFVLFADSFLCTGRCFAKLSRKDFPALPAKDRGHPGTHLRTDSNGVTYITKLLTDIPQHLSDEEATELIYFKIRNHLKLIESWAESEVTNLWERYNTRKGLEKLGTVKKVMSPQIWDQRTTLIDRGNPMWMANACATFKFHGFRMRSEGGTRMLYPHPLRDLASEVLALPVAGSLLPHMTLLVIEHPQITASFLENLCLFDTENQIDAVVETDSGWILDGDKFRRGPKNSQQKISLTERSIVIVAHIIELTRPLRDYLKKNGDPDWRYLFLECGKGFSYPRRIAVSHATANIRQKGQFEKRFVADGKMSEVDARLLAARFSLATVRATVGVVEYIQDPDVQKLARLLGHKELDMRLLARYLPAPLLRYFEERWVRLFQTGILVEALKGSKYLLPAVGFHTLDELNAFISNHALKWAERKTELAQTDTGHLFDSVVLAIDENILALLISVRSAVAHAEREVSKLGMMWDEYARKLFAYIEQSSPPREDFRLMLAAARSRDCTGLVSPEAVYA